MGTAAALVVGALLCFTSLESISPLAVVLGIITAASVLVAYRRRAGRPIARLSGRWGLIVDVAAILLLALAIPNLAIFNAAFGDRGLGVRRHLPQVPPRALAGPDQCAPRRSRDPRRQRLAVRDRSDQPGSAAWFLARVGFATFALLDGLMYALLFPVAHCVSAHRAEFPGPSHASALALSRSSF